MNIRLQFLLASVALVCFGAPVSASAADSFDACSGFINSLPATITTPGVYCLTQQLSTSIGSGNAVTVNADDVVIDCNDHRIDGSAAGTATAAVGVFAGNRARITLRHCAISGFNTGAKLTGSGHIVDGNEFIADTQIGLFIEGLVRNADSLVTENRVIDIGGSTTGAAAYGIYAHQGVDLFDNSVSYVHANDVGSGSANAYGIFTTSTNHGATVRGNRVRAVVKGSSGLAYGIYNDTSRHVILRDNDVSNRTNGKFDIGIYCSTSSSAGRNNVIHGSVQAISTCGNAGDNYNGL